MMQAVKDFLRALGGDEGPGAAPGLDVEDPRVAAAALLHHLAEADGAASAPERARLSRLIAAEYGLGASEAERVAAAGRTADAEAVDLYRFTSVLLRRLSQEQRLRFADILWDVAFVDDGVHELEDNVVWRICELLGIPTQDRMAAKRAAAGRAGRRREGS